MREKERRRIGEGKGRRRGFWEGKKREKEESKGSGLGAYGEQGRGKKQGWRILKFRI